MDEDSERTGHAELGEEAERIWIPSFHAFKLDENGWIFEINAVSPYPPELIQDSGIPT